MAATESLTLELHKTTCTDTTSEAETLMDLCTNLKSPDRRKSWKTQRLQRSKTYSGSPNMRLTTPENVQLITNKSDPGLPPVPLSPVNQKKWNKTNMKRRSSNATQRLSRSAVEECSGSALKVEVRHSSEISERAVTHRFTCSCKQYFDNIAGIVYKLQQYETIKDLSPATTLSAITTSESENSFFPPSDMDLMMSAKVPSSAPSDMDLVISAKVPTSSPSDMDLVKSAKVPSSAPSDLVIPKECLPKEAKSTEKVKSRAHTPDNIIATSQPFIEETDFPVQRSSTPNESGETNEFSFDFAVLDDTIVDLQSIQREIREVLENERWSGDADGGGCCKLKGCSTTPLHSTALGGSDSMLYLLVTVFTYLDIPSILEASRVCRQWHCASLHPAVWTTVTLDNRTLSSEVLKFLSRRCVATERLSITGCALQPRAIEEIRPFFATVGGTLRDLRLDLTDDKDTNRILDETLPVCSSLCRLHVKGSISDENLTRLSTYVKNLTCLKVTDLSQVNRTNFHEFDNLHCLSCSVQGFRAHEVENILDWFPELRHVTLTDGPSLHSTSVRFFTSHADIQRLSFRNTYVTPRALVYILSTCKKLTKLDLHYDREAFPAPLLGDQYMGNIRQIQSSVLFRDVLSVTICKPPRPFALVANPLKMMFGKSVRMESER